MIWLDPVIGIVGALVISRWSWDLIRDAGTVLLDIVPTGETLPQEISAALESDTDKITDLHVWQVGPGHHAAIIAIASAAPRSLSEYRGALATIDELSHVTIAIQRLD